MEMRQQRPHSAALKSSGRQDPGLSLWMPDPEIPPNFGKKKTENAPLLKRTVFAGSESMGTFILSRQKPLFGDQASTGIIRGPRTSREKKTPYVTNQFLNGVSARPAAFAIYPKLPA
jgi:hypothetical protein